MSAKSSLSIRRRLTNLFMLSLSAGAALVTLIPLGLILYHLMAKGFGEFNLDFFLHTPVPVGETGGGIASAIIGSMLLIAVASLIGLPIGISGGIYLSEYAGERAANIVRFMTDILNGAPSIVIGLFIYTLIVNPMKEYQSLFFTINAIQQIRIKSSKAISVMLIQMNRKRYLSFNGKALCIEVSAIL